MKTICFSLFILLNSSLIFSQNILNYNDGKCSHSIFSYQNHFNRSSQSNSHSYDVIKYRLNFDLYKCFRSPYPKSYTGSVVMIYRADSVINSLKLHSSSLALSIDSIKYSGISYTHLNDIIMINVNIFHLP